MSLYRLIGLILALSCLILGSGCGATIEPPEPIIITVVTTPGGAMLIQDIAETFNRTKPHISFEVTQANEVQSLKTLATGKTDMVIANYLFPGTEQFRQTPLALDGVVLVVHPDNSINNLTLLELQQIYSGKHFNWRDVQGLNQEIQVVVRERGAGSGAIFGEIIMKESRITPNARVFPNNQAIVDFVAQTPEAIGYVTMTTPLDNVKVLTIEEIAPTPATLANNAYPLSHLMYILTLPQSPAPVRNFNEFLLQPASQQLVLSHNLGQLRP